MARVVARAPTDVPAHNAVTRLADPGGQAAHARYARSHPASSTARATVLWRVWWRAHRQPYQPATALRANRTGLHRKPSETPKPSTRREIRAGTLSLLYRPLQVFTEEIAPRRPGNRPHARPWVRPSVKLYTLDRKPRPKAARSQRENPYTLRKRRLLFFAADQTITPMFYSWRFFRLQHSKRAHSRASRESVRAFGASSRVPARKIVQAVFYVFMAHFPKNRV
jgi:hypothetical protein